MKFWIRFRKSPFFRWETAWSQTKGESDSFADGLRSRGYEVEFTHVEIPEEVILEIATPDTRPVNPEENEIMAQK